LIQQNLNQVTLKIVDIRVKSIDMIFRICKPKILQNESEVLDMANQSGKKAGAKLTLVLLSVFLFLLLFALPVFAATYGDINDDGEINVQDVVLVMKHVLDLDELTTAQKAVADVNGDGNINVQDVTLIMQYSLGLIDEFPHAALTVLKVTAVNPKQVEVEFNRMLNTVEMEDIVLANFHVGLQAAPATNVLTGTDAAVGLLDDGKTVLLTIGGTNKFVNGSTTNRVVVKKEAGLTADYTDSAVTFTDTALPTLVSVQSVSPTMVVMTFSEPLDSNVLSPSNIELIGGTTTYSLHSASYVAAQRELRMSTFVNLTAGTYTLTIKSGTNLKDYSGYGVVPVSKTFTHTPITSAPTVSVKSSNERTVTIEFSREIDSSTLINNSNVLFRHTYDSTINQVSGNDVTNPSGDKKTFVIDFGDKVLPPGSTTVWMKYAAGTIDANKIKDTWGNIIAPASFTVTITPDTTPPTASVSVVSGANDKIHVQYSEEVIGGDVKANYSLKKGSSTVEINNPAAVVGYPNRYLITTVEPMQGLHTLTISNIKDNSPAENVMGTQTYSIDVPDIIAPYVVKVDNTAGNHFYTQSANNKVRIFFNEPMNVTDLATKTMYANVNDVNSNPTTATPASDGKSVYLVFANNVTGNLVVGALRDVAGNPIGISTNLTGLPYSVGLDTSLLAANRSYATTPTTVKLFLNDTVTGVVAADFVIDNGTSSDITPVGVANDTSSGKSVLTLTLASADALKHDADGAEIKTVATPAAKNFFDVLLAIAAGTAISDKIPPVIDTAVVSGGNIVLTFKENLDEGTFSPTGRNGFSVSGYTITSAVVTVAPNNDTVTITRSGGFPAGSYTVSYAAGEITDENGNALASFTKTTP
jgi:hypothetical protein